MKLLESHTRGIRIHVLSQSLYIVLSFYFFAQQRRLWWWLLTLAVTIVSYALVRLLRKPSPAPALISFTALAIGNSAFLNMESPYPWAYSLAAVLGVAGIYLFRAPAGRHAFNPSAIGAFALITLLPGYATSPAWAQRLDLQSIILVLGIWTAWSANRLRLSAGYFLSFVLCSVIFWWICGWLDPRGNGGVAILFWPSLMLSTSTLIFAFHVFTDPATSPSDARMQWAYGLAIGGLDAFFRVVGHLLLADFLAYLLVQFVYWAAVFASARPSPRPVPVPARNNAYGGS